MATTKSAAKAATTTVTHVANEKKPAKLEIGKVEDRQGYAFTIIAEPCDSNADGNYHFKEMQAINLLKRLGMVQTEALSGAKSVDKLTFRDKIVLKSAAVRFRNAVNMSTEPCYIKGTEVFGVAGEKIEDVNTGEETDQVYKKDGWRLLSPSLELSAEVSSAFQLSNERFEIAILTADAPAHTTEAEAPQIGA